MAVCVMGELYHTKQRLSTHFLLNFIIFLFLTAKNNITGCWICLFSENGDFYVFFHNELLCAGVNTVLS